MLNRMYRLFKFIILR